MDDQQTSREATTSTLNASNGSTTLAPFPMFDCSSDIHSIGQRWEKYIKRFENFLKTLSITNNERKRAMLLHYVGEETNDLFDTLPNTGTTYEEAVEAFNTHFIPLVNIEFETYKFRQLRQKDSELIDQFHMILRKSSALCNFQNSEREIKSQLIIGCTDNKLRRYALKTPEATLADLLRFGKTNEVSEKHSRQIEQQMTPINVNYTRSRTSANNRGDEIRFDRNSKVTNDIRREQNFSKSTNNHKEIVSTYKSNKTCKNCGDSWHYNGRKHCKALGSQCNKCGKYNHFARVCLSTRNNGNQNGKPNDILKEEKKRTTRFVNTNEQKEDNEPGKLDFAYNNSLKCVDEQCKEGYVKLEISGIFVNFLIDSGASVNIICKNDYERMRTKPKLEKTLKRIYPYAQCTPISMQGEFETVINYRNSKDETKQSREIFYVCSTEGISLLSKHTSLTLGLLTFTNTVSVLNNTEGYISKILQRFPNIFKGIGKCKGIQAKLHINSEIPPVINKHRRIPFHLREKVETELHRLEQEDIIEKLPENTATPWISPIVIVPKNNEFKEIRICVDMREPNKAIQRERHLTPTMEELIHAVNGAKYFSKLDMCQGYHQIELEENSRNITTFTTHLGLYRYKRLSFGINAAAEKFQKTVQMILQNISGVINMSDDILIYANTKLQHDKCLWETLKALNDRGITLNKHKCIFETNSVKFFGQIFSSEGVRVCPDKIKQIQNMPKPNDSSEVRSLLGMITFCSRYIPSLSEMSEPLRRLTKKNYTWRWTNEQDEAFKNIIRKLGENITLHYFDKEAETELWTDGSPTGLGAILVQHTHNQRKIISYASRMLIDPETRYAQIEREALAITWAIEHFEMYLKGSSFTVITDHQPLVTLFNNPRSKLSVRMERWRLRLLPYTFQVKYQNGKNNPADYLSRKSPCESTRTCYLSRLADEYAHLVTEADIPTTVTLEEIKEETRKDPMLQHVITSIRSYFKKSVPSVLDQSTYLSYYKLRNELITNKDGTIILKGQKIVIPTALQDRVINTAHQSHQGIVKTKQLIRAKVWFPKIDDKVEEKVKHCIKCQTVTKSESRIPLVTSELPTNPWEILHIDHKGPLPSGEYLLVITDLYSRFPVVEVVKSTRAAENITKLDEIFALLGKPCQICTDNGPPFNGHEIREYFKSQDITHRKITPRWPQANGPVERLNRSINKTLQIAHTYRLDWKKELTKMLKIYRATPHSTTNVSPAELLFNREMNIGLPNAQNTVLSPTINREKITYPDKKKKNYQKQYYDQHHRMENPFEVGDIVLVKQEKSTKSQTWYEPVPYVVTKTNQSMITAQREGKTITRNSSHFRVVSCTSKPDKDLEELKRSLHFEEEEPDLIPLDKKIRSSEQDNTTSEQDNNSGETHRNHLERDYKIKGGYNLRGKIKPPNRLIEIMN